MSDLSDKDWPECRMYVASQLKRIGPLDERIARAELTLTKLLAYATLGGAMGTLAIQGLIRLGGAQ